jgi:hypothetical protein
LKNKLLERLAMDKDGGPEMPRYAGDYFSSPASLPISQYNVLARINSRHTITMENFIRARL